MSGPGAGTRDGAGARDVEGAQDVPGAPPDGHPPPGALAQVRRAVRHLRAVTTDDPEFRRQQRETELQTLRVGAVALVAGVVMAALRQQLSVPADRRTWHGTVLVAVPYEFRAPTPRRFVRSLWDPDDGRVLVPRVWGVGWSVNLAPLVARARAATG